MDTIQAGQHMDIHALFAQVRRGMPVWGRDGKIGAVHLIVRHRHTGELSHLVVRRGWSPWSPAVIMPLHWMTAIENGRVMMNVRAWQLDHLASYRTDRQIKRDLVNTIRGTQAFMQSADYLAINVCVEQNVVLLRGNVRDTPRKLQLQALAHRVVGVHEVRNELIGDDDLERRIAQMVAADPQFAAVAPQIGVVLGVVDVAGTVPSLSIRDRLIEALRGVHGVRHIWDHVQVAASDPHLPALQPNVSRSRLV